MKEGLIQLADTYQEAGEAIRDAIRERVREAGGFVNCSSNMQEKRDMTALVIDGKKGYSGTCPILSIAAVFDEYR